MSEAVVLITVFLVVCGILGGLVGRTRLVRKRKRFEDRASLPLEEIYKIYYSTSHLNRTRVIELWNSVASTLKLDPKKMRPNDRFDTEYAPVKGFPVEDELVDLEDILEAKCKELGVNCHDINISTLDDYIKFMMRTKNDSSVVASI